MLLYKIGEVLFNIEKAELQGENVHGSLRAKTADLLAYLIRNRQRVISKQELMDQVWSDSVVGTATLVQSIQELRKCLGDSARNPRFIKTVPMEGYQWIHPVTELTQEPPEAESPTPDKPRWHFSASVIVVCALLLGSVGWLYQPQAQPDTETTQTALPSVLVLPVQNETGLDEYRWVELGLSDALLHALSFDLEATLVHQPELLQVLKHQNQRSQELARTTLPLKVDFLLVGSLQLKDNIPQFHGQLISHQGIKQQWRVALHQLAADLPNRLHGLTANKGVVLSQNNGAFLAYCQGLYALQIQATRQALNHFEHALLQDRTFAAAQLKLGHTHYSLGNRQRAEVLLNQLAERGQPFEQAAALVRLAQIASDQMNSAQAAAYRRQAAQLLETPQSSAQ